MTTKNKFAFMFKSCKSNPTNKILEKNNIFIAVYVQKLHHI